VAIENKAGAGGKDQSRDDGVLGNDPSHSLEIFVWRHGVGEFGEHDVNMVDAGAVFLEETEDVCCCEAGICCILAIVVEDEAC